MLFHAAAPLWRCGTEGGAGAGGGARTYAGRGGACLPDRCPAPQAGDTPLHLAAFKGHAAVAGQLLAAKADVGAKNQVMGEGGQGRG